MNETLWDLINTREIVSFIGDIIVGTEEEKEHDEVIEEVIKRLTINYSYVKPVKDQGDRAFKSCNQTRGD